MKELLQLLEVAARKVLLSGEPDAVKAEVSLQISVYQAALEAMESSAVSEPHTDRLRSTIQEFCDLVESSFPTEVRVSP